MTTPSLAAKAASILHHTWGVDGFDQAVKIYNEIDAAEPDQLVDILERHGVGVWEAIDNLDPSDIMENIEALALSIDAAHKHYEGGA